MKKSLVDVGFKNGSTIAIIHNSNMHMLSKSEQLRRMRDCYIEIGKLFEIDGLTIFQS